MFSRQKFRLASLPFVGFALAACAELTLPRFDGGVLNPEIRHLRAGEIVDSVKCALVAFMHERENVIMETRQADEAELENRKDGRKHCLDPKRITAAEQMKEPRHCQIEGRYFSAFHANVKKEVDQSFDYRFDAMKRECNYDQHVAWTKDKQTNQLVLRCIPNECDTEMDYRDKNSGSSRKTDEQSRLDRRLGRSVWDYDLNTLTFKEKGCVPVPDYSRLAPDPNQTGTIQLTLSGINSGFINFGRIDIQRTPFYPFIQPGNSATAAPFPQLLLNPKQTTTFDLSVSVPQSVHAYNLTPAAVNRDITPYVIDRIAAKERAAPKESLGPEKAPAAKGPMGRELNIHVQLTTLWRMRVALFYRLKLETDIEAIRTKQLRKLCTTSDTCPWSVDSNKAKELADTWKAYVEDKAEPLCKELGKIDSPLKDKVWKGEASWRESSDPRNPYEYYIDFACNVFPNKLYRIAAHLAKKDQRARLANHFYENCNISGSTLDVDDTTRIDFLGLKRMLHNVVEKQNEAIYRGVPDVTLSSLTMSSAFQITMEAQGGTQHFFRIVPVLAPPNTEVKFDHTHTLKVVLNGKKGKGDKQNQKRLAESCRERVPQRRDDKGATDICDSQQGQLLEAIIQAQEKAGSGSQ